VFVPVRSEDVYIGIKPLFEGRRAPLGKPVELSLIALNHLGKQIDSGATWTLVEEDYDYHWYRENGRWRYRRSVRDIPMTTGDIALESANPVTWSEQLSWGDYRLDMETEDGAKAGYQFSIGWGKAETSDAPDQLRIGASNGPFAAGDLVKLAVNAPYSGEGELVIANDKVRLIKPITLTEGGSELSFNFAPEWGDSVYALVTLYTPRDITDRPVPRRAVGISHVALDRSGQTLDIEIETKDVLRPRQDQSFTVNVDSAPRGEKVWMSFAAVDEGILQITKYSSPDAPDFYFGKKALAVDIRDDYGRILNANLGDPAIARTGGDSLGGEGLTVVPTRTVSLFSGPVRVKNGKAEVKFAVPDFNGELRLMASAWTESAVGSASSSVKVRDKVPAIVGLPRFLAPGDTAVATISLDNVEGAPGMYSAKFGSSDVVEAKGYLSVNLEEGQRLDNQVQMVSSETGTDELSLSITGPDNYEVGSTYPIQVRTPYMPVTKSETRLVEPGTSFDLSPDIISGFIPSGTDVTVSFSRLPGLDPAPYVDSLARYPYGCTEQTVSTAMPLLYADDLGGIPGQSENQRRRGLQKAISRLSSRQSLDGAFGLWRSGDQNASPWLGVYATDFMHRAKAEGLNVPPDVLTRAYKAVAEISRMPRYPNLQYDFPRNDNWGEKQRAEAAAYAHFVLAKAGKGNLGQMRYVFDNHRNKIKSPLARAYLGSALSLMGDKARANEAFMQAAKDIGYDDTRDYYQSSIRDVAGVIAASADAGQGNIATGLSKSFRDLILDENWLNTQEKSYVILALKSLMASMEPPKVSAKGVTISGKEKRPAASLLGTDLAKTLSFTSKDKTQFWATITVSGSPDSAPAPMAEGFALTKDLFDLSGKAVAAKDVKQGERMIVRLGFRSTANRDRTIVVADLLPAGFEIEAILTSDDGAQRNGRDGAYKWLGKISNFDVTEARDDRFIASHETSRRESYVAAYIARAVTLGDFVMPGAVIEDMYRPEDRAITESSRIKIIANPAL
jgi:uncharacterized protein YfaS (alpha-2-macroglobulin family)